jgi:branched-chain amino acid transport system substrate-binding protein
VIAGTDPTTGAQAGVAWLNKYADGIDGHPVKLATCFVMNAEAEGLTCAQQFLANKNIDVISYGAMALGAATIDATVDGKKPIVVGVSINPPDLKTPHTYILDAAVPYLDYPWATYAKNYLHATTAAVLYPNQAGQLVVMQAVVQALTAEGIKTKLVAMDPNSSDVTGALVAAGATSAGVVTANVATPSQCLAFAKSATQLGIDPGKIIGLPQCDIPGIKSQYPGGDFPKWNYVTAFPVIYENTGVGAEYKTVFAALGDSSVAFDPWSTVDFSDMLTLAKFMNTIGYSKLSPAAIEAQASTFKGPVLLGPSSLACGKYPSAPSVCSDGVGVLKYEGSGVYSVVAPWVETPPALQKQLGATVITP